MTLSLTGHPVEPGIAVGQAHIIQRNELDIGEYRIHESDTNKEVERLQQALVVARNQLEEQAARLRQSAGEAAEEIILTHIAMLSDSSIAAEAEAHIRNQQCNAEWALQLKLESLLDEFRNIENDYIRIRAEDVTQVIRLVQESLAEDSLERPLSEVPDRLVQTITVASELTPGELATLHERGVAGIITEHGSPHSHTAILARGLGIPTVMGVHRAQSLLKEDEQLVLDGHYGVVFATPEESICRHYLRKQAKSQRFRASLEAIRERPCISADGVPVQLLANAERPTELRLGIENGAEGVGLYRTEFMYLTGKIPDEAGQLQQYTESVQLLDGKPLTIRTLDLGADKGADLLDFESLRHNPNPALGLRAVRLCLRERDLFKTQLRAILRASAFGPIRCLIPMLTSVREVLAVRSLLDETREELRHEGIAFDQSMPLGGMIETPAAALALSSLSRHVEFLSVGTNDLIQYALAADRADEQVAHLYEPQHPGVVELLRLIFDSAARQDIPVSVCGELAGDRGYTRLLLALGLTSFSMHPRNLLEVKQVITETDISLARATLQTWFGATTEMDGGELLRQLDADQN
jgi:phosphotransferase system enzyme I (PtsI)